MRYSALRAFFILALAIPLRAAKSEVPLPGEFKPGGRTGAFGLAGGPIPIQLTVPALNAAQAMSPSPLPVPVPAPIPAPGEFSILPANSAEPAAPGQKSGDAPETAVNEGKVFFDQARTDSGDLPALAAAGPHEARNALPPFDKTQASAEAAPTVAAGIRPMEATEIGVFSLSMQILSGIITAIAGAHAAYPLLAGALWALAGKALILQLGSIRSTVTGVWQASHDQKLRTSYTTGKLKDIRSRKYGEDRYDILHPGAVSAREQTILNAAAVLLGLPWVLGGGPDAVGLYLLSAAAVVSLRRLRRSRSSSAAVEPGLKAPK